MLTRFIWSYNYHPTLKLSFYYIFTLTRSQTVYLLSVNCLSTACLLSVHCLSTVCLHSTVSTVSLLQVQAVSAEWAARADIPSHVANMIKSFPSTLHPMSQLSAAICALQSESKFAKAYAEGVHKTKYWEATYEDAMDLIAKLPPIAAAIYRNTFYDGVVSAFLNPYFSNLST